ncbi:MAG: glycerol-3-phosphate 1-O-acyltransferase PlsY [Pseudomonadota bacterium]
MSPDLITCAALILAYLLGSVSAAIIVCRLMGLPDPRTDGSGNPGTTNVLRIGGKPAALLTLAGDMLKGVIPVLMAREYGMSDVLLSAVGVAAFLGHLYPIFFRFEGGKGVATAFGVMLTLHWGLGVAVVLLWVSAFALTRISSVGAITAFVAAPFLAGWLMPEAVVGIAVMSVMLLARHKTNILALVKGTERRFK